MLLERISRYYPGFSEREGRLVAGRSGDGALSKLVSTEQGRYVV
jgi:hypothetical protein